jgi:hypothetical protein
MKPSDHTPLSTEGIATLRIILELFELRQRGMVAEGVWNTWCRDIDRFLRAPAQRKGRAEIGLAFGENVAFLHWIDERQSDATPNRSSNDLPISASLTGGGTD